ncbi:right-handed parallel beta-helix repeat-containing protein [Chitinophaga arvensicola]|uniref:Right handed beta helix region n=1 Tax=Chitinophaga arvensicola TaxID=29529 RepID=A0A1I0S8N9_9BACT|nr:right-handed parallel beta-helix repeat-containing protein [Chitinophaga arvensicola]SEW52468.1 Right handed beta helix region [Chitinophaga arvensicola]
MKQYSFRRSWKSVALAITFALTSGCFPLKAQIPAFSYKQGVADQYTVNVPSDAFKNKANEIAATAFDLTAALPKGYQKDGKVDYTSYLQTAMDQHKSVVLPDFPVLINDKGLTVGNDANIVFKTHSKLLLQTTEKDTYEILRVHNVQNVNIYFATIEGDRSTHKGAAGQWGMGIAIRAAKNVNIYAPRISKCWGDGIYVGGLKGVTSSNINIYNAMLDYNRRNGMSITSVSGLKLVAPVISNTYGQTPMSGIDIEPNNNNDVIDNILMENPVTLNNAKHGIVIALSRLIGTNPKQVDITIRGHQDDGSSIAFSIGGMKKYYDVPPMKGSIQIIDPVWKNNIERPFRSYKPNGYAPTVKFMKVSIRKTDKNGKDQPDSEKMNLMKKTIVSESKMMME